MFGVTHVCAVYGFSGKIVGFISMPVKSNTVIYEKLYRYAMCKFNPKMILHLSMYPPTPGQYVGDLT